MNILEQLREAEHFSSAEQNIIRYLLQYPETIINFSVRDLAKASYTSPSTVTRLVKKLDDGHGFSHFKARFFSEINSVFLASGDRTINTNETVHSIVQKIADLEQTAIEQTKQSIDYQTLVRAANLINSCSQLEFFGFGDNLHLVKPQMYRCSPWATVSSSTIPITPSIIRQSRHRPMRPPSWSAIRGTTGVCSISHQF